MFLWLKLTKILAHKYTSIMGFILARKLLMLENIYCPGYLSFEHTETNMWPQLELLAWCR